MSISTTFKDTTIGVGDTIKVYQTITEGDKKRTQAFEGMLIAIKARSSGKTIVVRRIGSAQVGIEKIFPLGSPSIEKIEVTRKGYTGSKHAKLYFLKDKSKKDIEKIYTRSKKQQEKKTKKKTS